MFRIPEGKSVSKKSVARRRLHWLLRVSRNINITFGDYCILVCELVGNTVCFCFCSYYSLIRSQGNGNPLFKFHIIMTSSLSNSFVRCEQFSIVVTRLNLIDLNKIWISTLRLSASSLATVILSKCVSYIEFSFTKRKKLCSCDYFSFSPSRHCFSTDLQKLYYNAS